MALLPLALLLCSVPLVTPVNIGARTLSLDGIAQHLINGNPGVSGWGGVFLGDSVLNDTSPPSLAILRHAGRHIKSRSSCPLVRLSVLGGVTSATAKYSETGEGSSSIQVTMPTQEGLAWDEIPVLGRYYNVKVLARVGGQCAPSSPGKALEQEHELTFTVGTPDGDVNVIAHTYTSRTRELLEGEEVITGGEGAAAAPAPAAEAAVVVGADGEVVAPPLPSVADPVDPLRILSYNVWNVNPPRYLHRDAKDRFRAYALRMLYLGEIVRASGAGIVAFQEVRYDSGLGGFPGDAPQTHNPWVEGARGGAIPPSKQQPPPSPSSQQEASPEGVYQGVLDGVVSESVDPSKPIHANMPPVARGNPYTMAVAWAVSSMWFNKTLGEISQSAQYRERNADKWSAVKSAPGWALYGGERYPWEAVESTPTTPTPAISEEGGNSSSSPTDASSSGGGGGGGVNPGGPYHQPPPKGPRSWSELQGAFLEHPHAQIEHLAASLPGYQYVHVPAQLYLDKDVWGRAEGPGKGSQQRDEEGPAIFSRWPILHSDYLLLSRNTSDEGDTHQRLCLHAVIDATSTSPTHSRTLVDVYTVHLSLSEAARNRTVPELLAFIKDSARGDVVMLTGDMNAEPHEPAMRALTAAGVVIVHPPPPPPPTPTPTPTPLPPPSEGGGEGGAGNATSSTTTPEGNGGSGEGQATPTPTPEPTPTSTPPPPSRESQVSAPVVVEPVVMGKGGSPLLTPPSPLRVFQKAAPPAVAALGASEVEGVVVVEEKDVAAIEHGVVSTLPLLCDTWRALYPEPLRSDPDASARRFALTFPSDDPIKRIDMQFLGCGPGMGGGGAELVYPVTSESQPHCSAQLAACGVKVGRTWTVGADPVPGTDMGDGKGFGMLHERSAWYASDHRGVVVELEVA